MLCVVTHDNSDFRLTAKQEIPIGHKVALQDIRSGDTVWKYGQDIGKAVADIAKGEHVHTHNLKTKRVGEGPMSLQAAFEHSMPAAYAGGAPDQFTTQALPTKRASEDYAGATSWAGGGRTGGSACATTSSSCPSTTCRTPPARRWPTM